MYFGLTTHYVKEKELLPINRNDFIELINKNKFINLETNSKIFNMLKLMNEFFILNI